MEKDPVHGFSLLKFEGNDGAVFFVMEERFARPGPNETNEEYQEHLRFFYEEHSCPTNWIGHCVAVIKNGDTDPHGFLEYVRSVSIPPDLDIDEMEQDIEVGSKEDGKRTWRHWFPEAFKTP